VTRVFIADPALKDQRGHHYNLTVTMSEALTRKGHEVLCLTNRAFPGDGGVLEAIPCFRSDTYDAHRQKRPSSKPTENNSQTLELNGEPSLLLRTYRQIPLSVREVLTPWIHSVLDRWRSDAPAASEAAPPGGASDPENATQELLHTLRNCHANESDVVLFHTCDGQTYRDVLAIFESELSVAEWNELPVFRLSTCYDENIMPHNDTYPRFEDVVRRLNNFGLIGTRVFLHAENELLARHLEKRVGQSVDPLCIPPFETQAERNGGRSSTVNIAYLGAARTEKGFTLLPRILNDLFCIDLPVDIEVYIQATPQILGYTPDVKDAVGQLKEIDDTRLELSETPLDLQAYQRRLAHADIMLLLYDPERYAFRGSGIAVESIISDTTVVTTEDTFPAFLAGDAGVAVPWGESPVPAILGVLNHIDRYRTAAQERREWYLHAHSASVFANKVSAGGTPVDATMIAGQPRYEDTTQWRRLIK